MKLPGEAGGNWSERQTKARTYGPRTHSLYLYIPPHRQPGYLLYFRGEFLIHSPSLIPTTRPRPRGSFIRPANYELEANVEPVKLRGSSAAWGEGCTRAPVSSCACGLRRGTPPRTTSPPRHPPWQPSVVSLSSTSVVLLLLLLLLLLLVVLVLRLVASYPLVTHDTLARAAPDSLSTPGSCVSFSNFPLVNVNRCWSITLDRDIRFLVERKECLVEGELRIWLHFACTTWDCIFFVRFSSSFFYYVSFLFFGKWWSIF